MTDQPKTRTITLTDRAPVRIVEAEWPVIAAGKDHDWDGEHLSQATRQTESAIRVRQHADGRAIVYAVVRHTTQWQGERSTEARAGEVLAAGDDVPAAIRRVGVAAAVADHVIAACIADLPPVDL